MKLLLFSRDPGATNQMIAVTRSMRMAAAGGEAVDSIVAMQRLFGINGTAPVELSVMGRGYAQDVWARAKMDLQVEAWDDFVAADLGEPQRQERIAKLLCDRRIDGVVTGLDDVDEPNTRALWVAAGNLKIPVAVFADNPDFLIERFTGTDGLIHPDLSVLVSAKGCDALVQAGMPRERIIVSENLHLAFLARTPVRQDGVERLRGTWQASPGDRVMLFASDHIPEMSVSVREYPDEAKIIGDLVDQLKGDQLRDDWKACAGTTLIVYRPHPRNHDQHINIPRDGVVPRVIISREGTSVEAIHAADLVVGVYSAMIEEARAMGKAALRLETYLPSDYHGVTNGEA